jgi:hypothetical protein
MLTISTKQYAELVRSLESILKQMQSQMKGGGPDDYSFPQMLEYYLYRHPMSMMEFYVDDGGVQTGGGFRSSFKKLMKKIGSRLGMVKDRALDMAKERGREELEKLTAKAKDKGREALKLGADRAKEMARDLGDTAIDRAQAAVGDVTKKLTGGHFYNVKGEATSMKGKHNHVHDTNPKRVRKMPPGLAGSGHGCGCDMKGGSNVPGSYQGVTGMGLNLQQLGFVSSMQPTVPAGYTAVSFNNHLKRGCGNMAGNCPPAGGYGSMATAIAGGAWGG